jgi:hypothetical protein
MTTIQGLITDSAGTLLDGRLDVLLDNYFGSDVSNPDTVLTRKKHEFVITGGAIAIDLLESESVRISYWFQFYPRTNTITPATYAVEPLLDFHAIVPISAAPYEFASLLPTGITNDSLSTGAVRVARAIFERPDLVAVLGTALKIHRSDSKPVGAPGDIWVKPTEGTIWRWNTAYSDWFSLPYSHIAYRFGSIPSSAENVLEANNSRFVPPLPYTSLLIEKITHRFDVLNTNNATNYWKFFAALKQRSSANHSKLTPNPYHSTATYAANVLNVITEVPSGGVIAAAQLEYLSVGTIAATGAPGQFTCHSTFTYSFQHP